MAGGVSIGAAKVLAGSLSGNAAVSSPGPPNCTCTKRLDKGIQGKKRRDLSKIRDAFRRNRKGGKAVQCDDKSIDLEPGESELRELASGKVARLEAETALLVGHGDGGQGVVVAASLAIEIGDHAVRRRSGFDSAGDDENAVLAFEAEVAERPLTGGFRGESLGGAGEERVTRESQRVGGREERTKSVAMALATVGVVTVSHEGMAEHFRVGGTFLIMRQAKSMAEFVNHSSDVASVPMAQADSAHLPVVNDRLPRVEVTWVERRRVDLPAKPAPRVSDTPIRRILAKPAFRFIPLHDRVKKENRLGCSVDAGGAEGRETLFTHFSGGCRILAVVVPPWFAAAHDDEAQKPVRVTVECEWPDAGKADSAELARKEVRSLFHHAREPLAEIRRRRAVARGKVDKSERAV